MRVEFRQCLLVAFTSVNGWWRRVRSASASSNEAFGSSPSQARSSAEPGKGFYVGSSSRPLSTSRASWLVRNSNPMPGIVQALAGSSLQFAGLGQLKSVRSGSAPRQSGSRCHVCGTSASGLSDRQELVARA